MIPRAEQRQAEIQNENSVVNLNTFKTKKLFSKIKAYGFGLLASDITKAVVKAPLNLLDVPKGELDIKDPAILLSLDVIGKSKGVLYLTFKYPREEVIAKMVMALSGVNETMVKKGAFIDEAQEAFEKACAIIYNSNFHVADGEVSSNFWVKIKEMKEKNKVDLVIRDDVHSFSRNFTKSEGTFQDVLEHFNEMALNVNVPVVLLSRVSSKSA
ncbi:MAG: DnaB-like helicase C-terminal domain-containing protein [Pseudomonadota bacterium]